MSEIPVHCPAVFVVFFVLRMGLKHFKSVKNWTCLNLAPSPEPGIFLGAFNQTEPGSGKFEVVLDKLAIVKSWLLFLTKSVEG